MGPICLDEIRDRHDRTDEQYHEFLREESMSLGRYVVSDDRPDTQTPHTEDEVYYVLDGRASVRIADEVYPVGPGDVIFVERHVEHRFVDVEEALELLVVFAPAEGTQETE